MLFLADVMLDSILSKIHPCIEIMGSPAPADLLTSPRRYSLLAWRWTGRLDSNRKYGRVSVLNTQYPVQNILYAFVHNVTPDVLLRRTKQNLEPLNVNPYMWEPTIRGAKMIIANEETKYFTWLTHTYGWDFRDSPQIGASDAPEPAPTPEPEILLPPLETSTVTFPGWDGQPYEPTANEYNYLDDEYQNMADLLCETVDRPEDDEPIRRDHLLEVLHREYPPGIRNWPVTRDELTKVIDKLPAWFRKLI